MLFTAAHDGQLGKVRMLLDRGADPTAACSEGRYAGRTPLSAARDHGYVEIVELLEVAAARREKYGGGVA